MAQRLATAIAVAVVFAAGCDRWFTVEATPSENFVLASLETTADLSVAIRRWNETLRPWLEGRELDTAASDGAQEELPKALTKVRAAMQRLSVPDDPRCDVLLEKLGRYVDWEESQFARRAELLAEAEAENPGSEANRSRVASAVDSIEEEAKKRRTNFYDVARDIGIDIVE